LEGERLTEPQASFLSARVKRRILGNSSVGVPMVGKMTPGNMFGVLDVDGAFRGSDWQLSYQLARSVRNSAGDFAGSAGLVASGESWSTLVRTRLVGTNFDVNEVGYVPWKGTAEVTALTGPVWYFDTGPLLRVQLLAGGFSLYEHADLYTDAAAAIVLNGNFRSNWGGELTYVEGKNKDQGHLYRAYEVDVSLWFDISPRWHADMYGGYSLTYNFRRDYLAPYSWINLSAQWKVTTVLELGATAAAYVEMDPQRRIEEVTYNARPFCSFTPINDLNIRVYVDNVFARSTGRLERMFTGFLFSYNFLPKSWIYLAYNELREQQATGHRGVPPVTGRVGVAKIKYLYFF
jgi:hypothetical protein